MSKIFCCSSPVPHCSVIAKIKSSEIKETWCFKKVIFLNSCFGCISPLATGTYPTDGDPDQTWSGSELEASGSKVSTKHIPRGNCKSSSYKPSASNQEGVMTLMVSKLDSIKMFSLLSESDIVPPFATCQNAHRIPLALDPFWTVFSTGAKAWQ